MMRENLMTVANEAYADHFRVDPQDEPKGVGFDGWLVVVRAFAFLIAGMLAISLATVI